MLLIIYIQYSEPLPGVDSTDRLQEPYGSPVHFNAELKTDEACIFLYFSNISLTQNWKLQGKPTGKHHFFYAPIMPQRVATFGPF